MNTLNERERDALARGLARWHRGRLIPIMKGAEETPEEKAAREAAEAAAAAGDKTFTQADVDRIVQERLARAKATPPADYDELKAAKAKLDELEAANKTELEKERARADKAEKERADALAEAKDVKLRSQLLAEVAKADRKIVDPDGALALLDRSQLELDDSGAAKNVADVVDKLLVAKPYLVAAAGGAGSNANQGAMPNGGKDQITREQLASMSPAEIETAVNEGRAVAVLGGK